MSMCMYVYIIYVFAHILKCIPKIVAYIKHILGAFTE